MKEKLKEKLQDKKVLAILAIVIVVIIIAIGAIFLIGGYTDCYGETTASSGNVTLEYTNDASASYYNEYANGSSSTLYFDEKTLVGSVQIDLSQVRWDENYESESGVNDFNHAKEYCAEEITEYLNSNDNEFYQNASITFYDENGNEIDLTNYGSGYFDYNMSINGNILTVDIYEDYQKDYKTPIDNDADYNGVLTTVHADTSKIKSATLTVDFQETDLFWYTVDVDLTPIFTLKHK